MFAQSGPGIAQKPLMHCAVGEQQSALLVHASSIFEQRGSLHLHMPWSLHLPQQQSTPVLHA